MQHVVVPIFLFLACVAAMAVGLLAISRFLNPDRMGRVKEMPYESGMDPVHDTRRRFDVRFYLLAIAFLVFDVELLFLYPWAVASRPWTPAGHPAVAADASTTTSSRSSRKLDSEARNASGETIKPPRGVDMAVASQWVENRHMVFAGAMIFVLLLTLGYVYDWRRGVFQWH